MKWLVSSFEPFERASSNSSAILSGYAARADWQGKVRFTPPLPVTFADAWPALLREIETDPSIGGVLALGQAESRTRISLERVALNRIDARIPDNAGSQPEDVPVLSGPDVYWTNIPWEEFPKSDSIERSFSAGTFVCNALMYALMDWARKHGKLGGFVHIPLLKSQTEPQFSNKPRMDDEAASAAMRNILNFLTAL